MPSSAARRGSPTSWQGAVSGEPVERRGRVGRGCSGWREPDFFFFFLGPEGTWGGRRGSLDVIIIRATY